MSLESFKNRTLGGSYGNPNTGTYKGQCVSYARKYMEEELGIPTFANGNAKDYYGNITAQKYFDKVSKPQNGDIVVYGAYKKNPYGHIGIYYNGQLLSQNYDEPLKVTVASLNLVGNMTGYLRKKGKGDDRDMITPADIDVLRIAHSEIGGWDLNKTHSAQYDKLFLEAWNGKPMADMIRTQWKNGANFRDARVAQAKTITDLQAALGGTKQQIADAQKAVLAAEAKVAQEAEKATTLGKKLLAVEAQRQADEETGNSFMRWLGEQLNKIRSK